MVKAGAGRLCRLGEIFQNAYVPKDFNAALKYWTEVVGVGPFFRMVNVSYPGTLYYGKPTEPVFSVSIAYWGDLQIELIEQHNDAPSIYTAWTRAGQQGLHHICIRIDSYEQAKADCIARGLTIAQDLHWDGGGAIYVDAGGGPGTMLEMIQTNDQIEGAFRMMKDASVNWDGKDPLRDL